MSNFSLRAFNVCANFAQAATRPLLPGACELCGAGSGRHALCAACEEALPALLEACPNCALPTAQGAVCGACLAHAPPFDAAHAALIYAPPVDQLVQAFKYRGRLALAGLFAEKLAARILATGSPRPDYLLAMPASQARQRERGYNQAQELARALGRLLHLPLANPAERVIDRPPQSALPWKERAKNVRGVFRAKGSVEGMSLAIVDDVMTTAASAAELAKTLKAGGARRVEVWVAARTLPPRS